MCVLVVEVAAQAARTIQNYRLQKRRKGIFMKKSSRQILQSAPIASLDLASISQQLQVALEEARSNCQQTRILVPIEAGQHFAVFLSCIECLLQHTPDKPLLVLTSASAQSELAWRWQTALSVEGLPLVERFPLVPLTHPLSEQARVCFSTVRVLQLQQIEDAERLATMFDVVVAYDFPSDLSAVWKRVIERVSAHLLLAFCANPKPEVIQWCDTIIGWENKKESEQQDAIQTSPAHGC